MFVTGSDFVSHNRLLNFDAPRISLFEIVAQLNFIAYGSFRLTQNTGGGIELTV